MAVRNKLLYKLNQIEENIKLLRRIVADISDQEISNILYNQFYEFGINIGCNLYFMKMILTREDGDEHRDGKPSRKLSNDELVKYFKENKKFLTYPS